MNKLRKARDALSQPIDKEFQGYASGEVIELLRKEIQKRPKARER